MTLIIGGRNAGKYSGLIEQGYKATDFGADFSFPILYKLNDLIKQLISKEISPLQFVQEQLISAKDIIIVCDEVGCGVVPISKFEREYREEVGRVCIAIASQADVVERVYCGIPTRIKG